jgi:hypothetical protein
LPSRKLADDAVVMKLIRAASRIVLMLDLIVVTS